MKLKEWADKAGIKYLTAYRWFRNGTLPVKAYQTDSGTILVEDEDLGLEAKQNQNNDATALFFKKTIEFSNNKSTLEDFAAYIFSTFNFSLKETEFVPKYSKNKPKPEEIQNHFKRFLPVQAKKPEPNMYIPDPETLETLTEKEEPVVVVNGASPIVSEEMKSLQNNYSTLLSSPGSSFDGSFKFGEDLNTQATSLATSSLVSSNSLRIGEGFIKYGLSNSNVAASFNVAPESVEGIYFTSQNSAPLDIDKPKRGRPRKQKADE